MWLINNPIGRWFSRRADRARLARIESKGSLTRSPSVALKAGLNSHDFALRRDCTHQEAIAHIEDCLRGERFRDADETVKVHLHGIV